MSIPTLSTLTTLAIQWHNGNENVKKNNSFNKQNNNFVYASHFFYIFFAALSLLWHKNAQFCILWWT